MIVQKQNDKIVSFLIAIIAAAIFIPLIGTCALFDWDEINFAECAREMLMSKNYTEVQLYYQPFWEKPPLFIWMQALSMHVFGINEFAARFPNAICGIITLLSLYHFGTRFQSQKFGVVWCLLYVASLLPHFYFKSGIIDPWFNLFIFLSMVHLYLMTQKASTKSALAAGLFLGLAVLTKGPAAVIIIGLSFIIFLLLNKQSKFIFSRHFVLFVCTAILVSSTWFIVEILKGHQKIILDFIQYQIRLFQTGDAGHDGPFFYHFLVLLIGCFPASIFFIQGLRGKPIGQDAKFRKIMLCLFWVVIILFSVVKTKIIHYSSLCYFPLTYIAASVFTNHQKLSMPTALKILYWFLAIVLSLAFVLIGFVDQFKSWLIVNGWIHDKQAILNLQASGEWNGFEFLIGFLFLFASWLLFKAYRQNLKQHLIYGLSAFILFNTLAIAIIVPRIGFYSQEAAIEFYKLKAKEDCYVETHAFKSYAQLFYGNRQTSHFSAADEKSYVKKQLDLMEREGHSRSGSFSTAYTLWLENGQIDKPAYIVVKTVEKQQVAKKSHFKHLYDKNGFSFFVRKVGSTVK